MADDDDRFIVQLFENFYEVFKAPQVNACLRLVEQEYFAALGDRRSEFDALEFAARKGAVYRAVDVVARAQPHRRKAVAHAVHIQLFATRKFQ